MPDRASLVRFPADGGGDLDDRLAGQAVVGREHRDPRGSKLPAEALYEESAKMLPIGRVGEPADIAAAYVYLLNQGYATGAIVIVDGGHVLV